MHVNSKRAWRAEIRNPKSEISLMATTQRYLALDVFRGLTIATMITVNNPGSWEHIYAPLKHSEWNGCTPTDLVFPFFLFIVGVSLFFSFAKYGMTLNSESTLRILRRTLLIFIIGLFLNSFPQWMQDYSRLRIMGVLQRIALAYCIGSIIALTISRKYLPWLSLGILLLYWGILYFFGGDDPFSLSGNITPLFDSFILGEQHLYSGFGIAFDPEGLLSTIPAVVTVIIGFLAGSMISETEKTKLPRKLLVNAIVFIGAGLIWSLGFPINKPLWTSSYVLYSAGWAFAIMALFIWIIDIKGYTKWTSAFVVFGMNPLFIFAFAGIWARILIRIIRIHDGDTVINGYNWLYLNIFQPLAGDINGSLLFALTHIVVFWFICWVLYKKKIFIKV
jgi:predicted acyltransferase